jgi:hypothetical protein
MRRPPTFLAAAGGLYAAWLAATYLLEGLPRTLLRPDAVALRAAYAVVANVLVGIGGGGLALTWLVRRIALPPAAAGVQRSARTVVSVVSGTALGIATYTLQSPPARAVAVTVNAFLQVFAVSAAEVVGVYHIGHSPPFDSARMIVFLCRSSHGRGLRMQR